MIALTIALTTAGAVIGFALVLTVVARLGRPGRFLVDWCAQAPRLDVVVALPTVIPWVVGPVVAGWAGLGAVVAGQIVGLVIWARVHELIYREAARGPRIVKALNGIVGRFHNHAALWVTAPVLPAFWLLRIAQIILYPMLVALLGFPRYRSGDWISVSRQKFEGLVGHDLIWCLYCEWMTGVYCLGAEMLRNVESFWCPIRFDSTKKCEHCQVDYPDIVGGWIAADGTMQDVTTLLREKYPAGQKSNPWFGHPARLTNEGEAIERAADGT